MKASLFFLPFLAVLFGSIGSAVGSSIPQLTWASALGWAIAAGLVVLWIALDIDNFKAAFARKGAKYGASSGLVVLLGLAIIVGVAVLTSRPRFNKSLDVTSQGVNTLSEQSKKVVRSAADQKKTITVTAFFIDDQVKTQFSDLLSLYRNVGGDFQIKFINPNEDPTTAMAQGITAGNTVIIEAGEQETRLTTFTEEKLTNALVNVLKGASKKLYFTTGHGEADLRGTEAHGFSAAVQELENQKNEVAGLQLLETARVPDDANAVIIAGPKYDFNEEEIRMLDEYLRKGGSLLAMVNAMVPAENLNKLLEKYGMRFRQDLLILPPDDIRSQLIGQNNALVTTFDEFNNITKDFSSQSQVTMVMQNTRSLEEIAENHYKLQTSAAGKTSDSMIRVKDVSTASDLQGLTQDRWELGAFPVLISANGKIDAAVKTAANAATNEDTKTDASTADEGTEDSETRVVAVGSADFATNAGIRTAGYNMDLFMNIASYLVQDEDFISIRPKDPAKTTIDLTSSSSQLSLLVLAFIYPFLFLGTGTFYWLKRRRA